MIKFDEKGLVPVIVQDVNTKEILMLAYANREALKKTLETGYAHYWSRSRKKIWMKGETSGNIQRVVEVRIDCDGDAILYLVEQKGVACHTGNYTCFYRQLNLKDLLE
ncbi:MAG TPA: phosphoribosyl-AMP cyclohydrolase [Archaeoglobus profundus]|nr:phosphoribosyl-AMP cyclohydrolase [Archaeoglobus profundus]